jgi:hypothetical protein
MLEFILSLNPLWVAVGISGYIVLTELSVIYILNFGTWFTNKFGGDLTSNPPLVFVVVHMLFLYLISPIVVLCSLTARAFVAFFNVFRN